MLRELKDPDGTLWRIWDVRPSILSEEDDAVNEERRVSDAPEIILERRSPPKAREGLERGWLAFESADEKRRLAPIPPDWENCPEERLLDYRDRATPLTR